MTDKSIDKREESLRVFSQTAKIYDLIGPQIFAYFGQRLVDLADLDSGGKVLDVAAQRGALLFPVAAKVGPTGHVTAKAQFARYVSDETVRRGRRLNGLWATHS